MELFNLQDLSVLTKKKVNYVVVEREEKQALVAILGRVAPINGLISEARIFPRRNMSENFSTLNSFYSLEVEKAVEALEDISVVFSDYPEILREIKHLMERTLTFREKYIKLLEKIKNLRGVQTTIYVRDRIRICDFCGEVTETLPFERLNLCQKCLDYVNNNRISPEIVEERMKLSADERELLKTFLKSNPLTRVDLIEILTSSDKWNSYNKLLKMKLIEEEKAKYPGTVRLTENGRRLAKIC
jgi:hypothetical protein